MNCQKQREEGCEIKPKPLDLEKLRTRHMLDFVLYCEENLFLHAGKLIL